MYLCVNGKTPQLIVKVIFHVYSFNSLIFNLNSKRSWNPQFVSVINSSLVSSNHFSTPFQIPITFVTLNQTCWLLIPSIIQIEMFLFTIIVISLSTFGNWIFFMKSNAGMDSSFMNVIGIHKSNVVTINFPW